MWTNLMDTPKKDIKKKIELIEKEHSQLLRYFKSYKLNGGIRWPIP